MSSTAGALLSVLYCIAGLVLFLSGSAPVLQPDVKFLSDKFAMAWAGWKFSGVLYFALINFKVDRRYANFVTMVLYCGFDVFAGLDTEHWTPKAWSFVVIDGAIGILSLFQYYKFGAFMNSLFVVTGVALFITGDAPVITETTDFFGNTFAMAWAGWKFSGCLYFALVNWDLPNNWCNLIVMVCYCGFDVFASLDTKYWAPPSWAFVFLDGMIVIISVLLLIKQRELDKEAEDNYTEITQDGGEAGGDGPVKENPGLGDGNPEAPKPKPKPKLRAQATTVDFKLWRSSEDDEKE